MAIQTDRYVLDASVAVKWYLGGEPNRDLADPWLGRLLYGEVRLSIPRLFFDELGYVLIKSCATHNPRISKIEARAVFLELQRLPLEAVEATVSDRERAFDLALRHSKIYYDMVYIALAERLDCRWLTADERVLKSSGSDFPAGRVQLLTEF